MEVVRRSRPNAAAFLFRGLLLTLRFETFDVGKPVEVAIKRSDGYGLSSGNGGVICINKIHRGVREVFQCTQQNGPVIDFNSGGFNDAFEGRSDGGPIERIERLQHPRSFSQRNITEIQDGFRQQPRGQTISGSAGNGWDDPR